MQRGGWPNGAAPFSVLMKLQGIFSPITTPFNHEGEIWKVKVQHNIEKWNATGPQRLRGGRIHRRKRDAGHRRKNPALGMGGAMGCAGEIVDRRNRHGQRASDRGADQSRGRYRIQSGAGKNAVVLQRPVQQARNADAVLPRRGRSGQDPRAALQFSAEHGHRSGARSGGRTIASSQHRRASRRARATSRS